MSAGARIQFKSLTAAVLLLVSLQSHADSMEGVKTEIYTDHKHPITHPESIPNAVIYFLDGALEVQDWLSRGLPDDPVAAQEMIRERLTSQTDTATASRLLQNAASGLMRAVNEIGIDRYPAVVFIARDGQRAVIYGVTDLSRARTIYSERGARDEYD